MIFPYIAFYFFGSFFALCYSKSRDKSASTVFIICTFLCLFLPLALRYNIGTDYENYVRIVGSALRSGIYTPFEIGWTPIIYLIGRFDWDIHVFFLIPALLSTLIVLHVVPKKYFHFCIPLYISIAWIESFSLVRQAFATTLFLLATKSFFKRRYARFVIWAAVSCCFHKSTVVLAVLTVIAAMKWQILGRYVNFAILSGFYVLTRFINIGKILMEKVIGATFYAYYITSQFNQSNNDGTGLGILVRLVVFILFTSVPYAPPNSRERRIQYNVTCIYIFLLAAGHMLAYQVHIFNRIPNLFSPFYILFAMNLAESKSRYRRIAMPVVVSLVFLLFIVMVKVGLSSNPGGLGITPYQSIFSR